jgi:putative SOS response-associated peptidase YedK
MCGRYVAATSADDIASYFDAEFTEERVVGPSWNVAPTDDVPVVLVRDGTRHVDLHHWGLVPRWADSPKVGGRMINARAETLATKGAFKQAFARRRCLVPADGFYEWRHDGSKAKQPYFIHSVDGRPLAFAGLWERWQPDGRPGEQLYSATIVTTVPNDLMATLHDRMPVILDPDACNEWLDPANDDVDELSTLLVPCADELLSMHPVSRDVGNVRNQGPQLAERVALTDPAESTGTLF